MVMSVRNADSKAVKRERNECRSVCIVVKDVTDCFCNEGKEFFGRMLDRFRSLAQKLHGRPKKTTASNIDSKSLMTNSRKRSGILIARLQICLVCATLE